MFSQFIALLHYLVEVDASIMGSMGSTNKWQCDPKKFYPIRSCITRNIYIQSRWSVTIFCKMVLKREHHGQKKRWASLQNQFDRIINRLTSSYRYRSKNGESDTTWSLFFFPGRIQHPACRPSWEYWQVNISNSRWVFKAFPLRRCISHSHVLQTQAT